jgi:DNA-binding MarR family transcriptional regulator
MPGSRQAGTTDAELAQRLHAAAIRLLRRARRADVAMGLPPGQASALSVLVFGGAKTLSELAAIEQVQPPTMTRMVDALEEAGLVSRKPQPDDRRRVRIAATAAGVRLMHKGRERRVTILARSLSSLDRREREILEAALQLLEHLPTESRDA